MGPAAVLWDMDGTGATFDSIAMDSDSGRFVAWNVA